MMQSILLTSPAKTPSDGRLSEASSLDTESVAAGQKAEDCEVKSRFSDLFDSLLGGNEKEIAGKGKKEGTAAEESVTAVDGLLPLEGNGDPVDSDIISENMGGHAEAAEEKKEEIFTPELLSAQVTSVAHTDNGEVEEIEEIEETEETEEVENVEAAENPANPEYAEDIAITVVQQPLDSSALEKRAEHSPASPQAESPDQTEGLGKQNQAAIIAPSILEQIETAQKIDTQVSEPKKMAQVDNAGLDLSGVIKKGQEKQLGNVKEALSGAESSSLKVQESDTNSVTEPLKAENAQTIMNKTDPFLFTGNGQTERTPFISAVDAHASRAANLDVSNLSKSIHQNLAGTASPALEQPLELQAKHGSALLGERILMMIGQGKQEVSIRLDPAELGSMHIKLQVQQDQVQLTIHTQVAQSRDIIEQNLPRLREQLAQQGVSLGETSVEQQGQQQSHNQQGKSGVQEGRISSGDGSLQAMTDKTEWVASKIALPAQGIDYYA